MLGLKLSFEETFDLTFQDIDLEQVDCRSERGDFVYDELLARMAALRGFDGLPQIVPNMYMADMHSFGTFYRGTSNYAAVNDFLFGPYRPRAEIGGGGSGFYAAFQGVYSRPPYEVALHFARKIPQRVLQMGLRSDAAIAAHAVVYEAKKREQERLEALKPMLAIEKRRISNRIAAIQDMGRAALWFGVDAIRLEINDAAELCIVNRSKVLVHGGY